MEKLSGPVEMENLPLSEFVHSGEYQRLTRRTEGQGCYELRRQSGWVSYIEWLKPVLWWLKMQKNEGKC